MMLSSVPRGRWAARRLPTRAAALLLLLAAALFLALRPEHPQPSSDLPTSGGAGRALGALRHDGAFARKGGEAGGDGAKASSSSSSSSSASSLGSGFSSLTLDASAESTPPPNEDPLDDLVEFSLPGLLVPFRDLLRLDLSTYPQEAASLVHSYADPDRIPGPRKGVKPDERERRVLEVRQGQAQKEGRGAEGAEGADGASGAGAGLAETQEPKREMMAADAGAASQGEGAEAAKREAGAGAQAHDGGGDARGGDARKDVARGAGRSVGGPADGDEASTSTLVSTSASTSTAAHARVLIETAPKSQAELERSTAASPTSSPSSSSSSSSSSSPHLPSARAFDSVSDLVRSDDSVLFVEPPETAAAAGVDAALLRAAESDYARALGDDTALDELEAAGLRGGSGSAAGASGIGAVKSDDSAAAVRRSLLSLDRKEPTENAPVDIDPSSLGESSSSLVSSSSSSRHLLGSSSSSSPKVRWGPLLDRSSVRVLIGVTTAFSSEVSARRRAVVRATWASDVARRERGTRVAFFAGQPPNGMAADEAADVMRRFALEHREHGDVVVLRGADEYSWLARKTLRLLRYAAAHPDAYTHILKTDDDCYVRVPLLIDALRPRKRVPAGSASAHRRRDLLGDGAEGEGEGEQGGEGEGANGVHGDEPERGGDAGGDDASTGDGAAVQAIEAVSLEAATASGASSSSSSSAKEGALADETGAGAEISSGGAEEEQAEEQAAERAAVEGSVAADGLDDKSAAKAAAALAKDEDAAQAGDEGKDEDAAQAGDEDKDEVQAGDESKDEAQAGDEGKDAAQAGDEGKRAGEDASSEASDVAASSASTSSSASTTQSSSSSSSSSKSKMSKKSKNKRQRYSTIVVDGYRSRHVYLGSVEPKTGFKPIRNPQSKWYISREDLPNDAEPVNVTYAAGWGYLLSRDLAEGIVDLHSAWRRDPAVRPTWFERLPWEDVMVGTLVSRLGGQPISHPGFKAAWRACTRETIIKHLDVDSPRLVEGLWAQELSGLWDERTVQCLSGKYPPGNYRAWRAWRETLQGVQKI